MRLRTIPSWKRTPFLRIVIPFSLGIMLQYYFPLTQLHAGLATVSFILVLISLLLSPYYVFRVKLVTGIAINMLIFSSGALCLQLRNPLNENKHIAHSLNIEGYIASIDSELSERAASFRATANVHFIIAGKRKFRAKGKIIFYFPKKDSLLIPDIGTVILIHTPPNEIPSTHNPGGFDFKSYCALKGIYHQQFLLHTDYTVLIKGNPHWFDHILISIKNYILSILRKHIKGSRVAGLAEALLIGYKEDLDDELLDSYSNTGVVHVIAISGLHLALIYWILDKISKLFMKNVLARALLVIAGLWLFTLLAGASPSVVRSAVMFSMIVVGEAFNKRSDILNGLAASAFMLLCFDPYWLWDLGFQLSYAAVLSLVLFAKPVYDLFYIKNKSLDQLWKMVSVTIAAQVCTIPVILYNFHQFPVYFIITNIICVPLSSAILILELILCSISFIPFFASLTGTFIFYGIKWMNASVEFFEKMPFASIDHININQLQVYILFSAIAFLYLFLKEHHSKKFLAFLFLITIYCNISLIKNLIAESQSILIIYNIPRTSAIDVVESRKAHMIADSSVFLHKKTWKQQVEPSRIFFRIKSNSQMQGFIYPSSNKILQYRSYRILLINRKIGSIPSNIDVAIISSSPAISIKELTKQISPRMVVIDGSNSRKKISSWKAECAQLSIECHVTSEQGAFVMNLISTNFAASHKDFDQ